MKHDESSFDWRPFRYDPVSGAILMGGKRVGTHAAKGPYELVAINGNRVLSHRLAWKLATGAWPAGEIDHIDGNGRNNRWENLRQVSSSENKANRATQKNCRSGFKGVHLDATHGLWCAAVQFQGKRLQFKTRNPFSAIVASRLIRRVVQGDFAIEARPLASGGAA